MDLSEAVRHVLKNNGQTLLTGFLKEDLKALFLHIKHEVHEFIKSASLRSGSYVDFKKGAAEGVAILAVLPGRTKTAFKDFREGFIGELDRIDDPKEKTVFSIKVIGGFSNFVARAVYELRKGKTLKKTALGQFLMTELAVRLCQLFVARFISEVAKHVTDPEELKRLRAFKKILSAEHGHQVDDATLSGEKDRAQQLVDNFKNYIMTGKDS